MLFGTKDTFGIECELAFVDNGKAYGYIRVWVDHLAIGHFDVCEWLQISGVFLRSFLDEEDLTDPEFVDKSAQQIWAIAYDAIYGGGSTREETHQLYARFVRFLFCPGGGAPFDGWIVVMIDREDGRWLVGKYRGQEVEERPLSKNAFAEAVRAFADWLQQVSQGATT